MHISINTDEGLSDLDRSILSALIGVVGTTPAPAAAAKSATPAKAANPEPVQVDSPVPDPEPGVEPDEDLVGGDTPTLQDALDKATALVAGGKAAAVKAALTAIGHDGKVSALSVEQVPAFLDALED